MNNILHISSPNVYARFVGAPELHLRSFGITVEGLHHIVPVSVKAMIANTMDAAPLRPAPAATMIVDIIRSFIVWTFLNLISI